MIKFLSKLFKHLILITRHRHQVFIECCKCGIPLQGLLHDLSKYSLTELSQAKYYLGTSSPIEEEKRVKGYSLSWLHHRGLNKHHSQYWVDISFGSVTPCKMPYKYVVELICDGVAAGKIYQKSSWNNNSPLKYWEDVDHNSFYHRDTREFLFLIYNNISIYGWDTVAKMLRDPRIKLMYSWDLSKINPGLIEHTFRDVILRISK